MVEIRPVSPSAGAALDGRGRSNMVVFAVGLRDDRRMHFDRFDGMRLLLGVFGLFGVVSDLRVFASCTRFRKVQSRASEISGSGENGKPSRIVRAKLDRSSATIAEIRSALRTKYA